MAEYKNNETVVELGEILTNRRGTEMLRISKHVNNDNGEESYDIRRWYLDDTDTAKPTAKGIRVKKDMMRDIIALIEADLDELDTSDYDENEDAENEDAENED